MRLIFSAHWWFLLQQKAHTASSCKALQTLPWLPPALSSQLERNSWSENSSSKWRNCWWHLPGFTRSFPTLKSWSRVIGICCPKHSPDPADISAAHWADLGNDRNYENSAGQGKKWFNFWSSSSKAPEALSVPQQLHTSFLSVKYCRNMNPFISFAMFAVLMKVLVSFSS